jgi:hypothetical protein
VRAVLQFTAILFNSITKMPFIDKWERSGAPQRRLIMYDKAELCNKIHEIYPQIGECDIDLNVAYNEDRNAWAVDF